jgi:hypothetical protein
MTLAIGPTCSSCRHWHRRQGPDGVVDLANIQGQCRQQLHAAKIFLIGPPVNAASPPQVKELAEAVFYPATAAQWPACGHHERRPGSAGEDEAGPQSLTG